MLIELGLGVECADGSCGTVGDVVINPRRRTVTHVVVEPQHGHHLARFVPVDAVDANASGTTLRLTCTSVRLQRYPFVEATSLVVPWDWPLLEDEHWQVGVWRILAVPFDDTVDPGRSLYPSLPPFDGAYMTYDRIPAGEVELRRASAVAAVDGRLLGHLDGFVVEGDGHITDLVLERGHLWGRSRLTVPMAAVGQLRTDEVALELTRAAVASLEWAPVRRERRRRAA